MLRKLPVVSRASCQQVRVGVIHLRPVPAAVLPRRAAAFGAHR